MLVNIHTHEDFTDNTCFSIHNIIVKTGFSINFFDNHYYSIGIHPWYIEESQLSQQVDILTSYANKTNVIAIGETGLDKIKGASFKIQETIFKKHILLSEKLRKPLIIHCVKSYNEIIELKKEVQPKQPWIVHGFRQNDIVAEQLVKNGFKISLGSYILSDISFHTLISGILKNEMFFLETDEADRKLLPEIYKRAAELKSITFEELEKQQIAIFEQTFSVKLDG